MQKILVSTLVVFALFGASVASAQAYYGSCVNLSNDLSYGSRSSQVSDLQRFLVSQNFPGGGSWMVTGYFGNATLAAMKIFQQQQGIAQTGVADSATRAAISRVSCGTSYQPYASSYPYLSYPYSYNYNFTYTYPSYPTYPGGSVALTSMSQNTGAPGVAVTLYGTGFDAANNTVYFGNQPLPGIASGSGTSLTFTVPAYYSYGYNQSVQIYVQNSRGLSNKLAFTVNAYPSYGCNYYQYQYGYPYNYNYGNCYQPQTPPQNQQQPVISYLNPSQGAVGSSVTVFGSGFSTTGNIVHFGPGVIANLNSPDGQSVSFTVPTQLTGFGSQVVTLSTYQVSVTNSLGYTSNAMAYTVTSLGGTVAPTIASVQGPTSLQAGISGTWTVKVNNPSGTYLTTSVTWGDEGTYGYQAMQQPQVTYAQGETTLTFTHTYYTTGTRTVTFTVSNQSGQSNVTSATVNVTSSSSGTTLTLTSLAPSAGSVGTQVTVYGTGFTYANTIHFGTGVITNVYSGNGTSMSFTVPSYLTPYCAPYTYCPQYVQQVTPGQYQVSVENQNGTSAALTFQVN